MQTTAQSTILKFMTQFSYKILNSDRSQDPYIPQEIRRGYIATQPQQASFPTFQPSGITESVLKALRLFPGSKISREKIREVIMSWVSGITKAIPRN